MRKDEFLESATAELANRLGIKANEVEIVAQSTETGKVRKRLDYFVGRPKEDSNGIHAEVVIADGESMTLSAAEQGEGRKLFLPPPIGPIKLPDGLVPIAPDKANKVVLGECDQPKVPVTFKAPPVKCPVDVYFLIDTTGSMGTPLNAIKAGIAAAMASLTSTGLNIWFGAGQYRDRSDGFMFNNTVGLTAVQPSVTAAINGMFASGGGGTNESQFFAMHQIAENAVGWRPDSCRYLVWIGDAPSNEPMCPSVTGLANPITRASLISKLQGMGIEVHACDISQLDGNPANNPGEYASFGCPTSTTAGPGQATAITSATGGAYMAGLTPATLVSSIVNSLMTSFQVFVSIAPYGGIVPFVTSVTPSAGIGPVDPGKEVTFTVSFDRGLKTCAKRDQVFDGGFDIFVDGKKVSSIPYQVVIPKCRYRYPVKFVCGILDTGKPVGEACVPVLPGRYATEINILNTHCSAAIIEKNVIPMYLDGKAIAREPNQVREMARDKIELKPGHATLDDCCRISQLLKKPVGPSGPLMIGYFEIVSDVPLTVTAVYTASDINQTSLSIDVERIEPVIR